VVTLPIPNSGTGMGLTLAGIADRKDQRGQRAIKTERGSLLGGQLGGGVRGDEKKGATEGFNGGSSTLNISKKSRPPKEAPGDKGTGRQVFSVT